METITSLVRQGWVSEELKNLKSAPLGGPIKLTKDGQEITVNPDGSTEISAPGEGKSNAGPSRE